MKLPTRRDDLKTILLPDGYVVVHSSTNNWVYTLSPVAGLTWEFCDGELCLPEIAAAVSAASGLELSLEQVEQIVAELREADLFSTTGRES